MRTIKLGMAAAAMVLASVGASPAFADDAAASFSATNPGGSFTYGSTNGTAFTPFTSNSPNCPTGTTCLQNTVDTGGGLFLPGVYKSTDGTSQTLFNTIALPGNALVVHPGPDATNSVYASFTAAAAGLYSYVATFTVADTLAGKTGTQSNGVTISSFGLPTNSSTTLVGALGTTYTFQGTTSLAQNGTFGFIVGNNGQYYFDGTQMAFTVTAAPEPATWMMMILGFGLVGGALRRKPAARLATAA